MAYCCGINLEEVGDQVWSLGLRHTLPNCNWASECLGMRDMVHATRRFIGSMGPDQVLAKLD